MTDKLSPKPIQEPLWGWKELDNMLQSNFKLADKNSSPSAMIDSSKYEMSIEEIVKEAEKQGYKVTVKDSGHIEFTD